MAVIKERIVIDSVDKTKKGYNSAQKNTSAFNKTLNTLKTTMVGMAGFLGLNVLSDWMGRVASASDTVIELDARVRLATDSTGEFNYAQEQLVDISLDTNSALEGNSELFARLNKSIKGLGGTTQSTLNLTELLSNGLRLSGASTQRSTAFTEQFIQAMDSGVVRGDEFNSMAENGGRIMQAMADGLGVAKSELRGMAEEGKLTAKIVNEALLSQFQTLQDEVSQVPVTTGRAWENVLTKYMIFLKDFKELNGTVAEGISLIATHFNEIASAIGIAIKVSAILYGAHLVAAAKEKIITLKQEQVEHIAAAEAVKTQAIAEKEQAAAAAQVHARKAQFAAQEATQAVQRHQQAIQASQDTIRRITLTEKELGVQVRQLKWEIRSNTAKKGTAFAEKQLAALKHRHMLATESLRTATMSLAGSENKLTTAIEMQSGAIRANSAAMKASANATAVASGKMATAATVMTRASAAIGKASSFLLGIPGLLLYAAYEIADAFLNMDALLVALGSGFKKIGAAAVLAWKILSNPGDLTSHLEAYRAKLDQIDKETTLAFDRIIENEQQKQTAYQETEQQHVASSLEAIQKIAEEEKKYQKEREEALDAELAIKKIALAQQIEDKSEYEAAIKELETKNLADREQLTIDRLANETQLYTTFYDEQIAALTQNNEKIAQEQTDTDEINLARARGLHSELIDLYAEANDKIAAKQKGNNGKILQLERDKAEQLKKISKETLNVLIADANRLVAVERDARARSKSVVRDYADFIRKINGDQRTDYQKNSDAQTLRREIESKLREASKAELEGNHKKAQRLNEEALSDAKDLAAAQKEHADSAKEGSLTQIRANGNVKAALDLVKKATEGVKTSSDQLADSAKDDLRDRVKAINSYKELIKELDKQLNQKRTISADVNTRDAFRAIRDINRRISDLNQTVTVTVVEKRVKAKQTGGLIYKADGGFIPRKNKVPGTGTGDKIKAMLEPGEFIMRKSAVQKFGESAMYALNEGKDIIRRKAGGLVAKVKHFSTGGLTAVNQKIKDLIKPNQAQTNKTEVIDSNINLNVDSSNAVNKINEINNAINSLSSSVSVDVKTNHAQTQINTINELIRDLNQQVDIDINNINITEKINSINENIKQLNQRVDIDIDTLRTAEQTDEINNDIEYLNQSIDIDIDTLRTAEQIDDINDDIEYLNQDVDIDIDSSQTYDAIDAIDDRINDLNQTIRVDIDSSSSSSSSASSNSSSSSSSSASENSNQETISPSGEAKDPQEELLKNVMVKYEKQYSTYLARAQQWGVGKDSAFDAANATNSAFYIKNIMDSIPQLAGKSPEVVTRVMDYNEQIEQFIMSRNRGMERGDAPELQKLLTLRDSWMKFNTGGRVPGTGSSDTVKALLTPGEMVITKDKVRQFGEGFFNAINAGIIPANFNKGGLVGGQSNSSSAAEAININLDFNGKQAKGLFQKDDTTMRFIKELKMAQAAT